MARFDYKLLYALHTVMQEQSFEGAALKLHISQSAVSQRIKALEEYVAQPVIIRGQPIIATATGQKLLRHYRQVQQLESVLNDDLLLDESEQLVNISVAVNADSLATWFISAIVSLLQSRSIALNLLILDERRTTEKLQSGEACAAVSSHARILPGYQAFELGKVKYLLVASPAFKQRYFSDGINAVSLQFAPGVSFDAKDNMHTRFIEQHFGLSANSYPRHTVPSSEAFVELARQGAAYCLIPELQIKQELASGDLVNLLPDKAHIETLYWHSWGLAGGIYRQLADLIQTRGREMLNEKSIEV
ncbi:LysR family transcriptional regulator ArgP [Thalassomonas actiniarum]|uniref:LysR family transcriptional regulator ArgP n=1 Tax=Thalassomonas actiniarum TaxID=485447 RepID=A0AAE9YW60_9GAMM|nr:LysR family transcriptional regulator ArgP [Thalassomonas actiniarum]WDE00677.1 LysR family transcriptional regulator ArgP [Thalassomonas actiniarum]